MDEEKFRDHVLEERRLLHELSNKFMIVQGMKNSVKKKLEAAEGEDLDVLVNKLEKAIAASDHMVSKIKDRRNFLRSISESE